MSVGTQEAIVGVLHRPGSWLAPVEPARLVETHISRVLIGAEYALKLKRRGLSPSMG